VARLFCFAVEDAFPAELLAVLFLPPVVAVALPALPALPEFEAAVPVEAVAFPLLPLQVEPVTVNV
jgi:hypothetical protein